MKVQVKILRKAAKNINTCVFKTVHSQIYCCPAISRLRHQNETSDETITLGLFQDLYDPEYSLGVYWWGVPDLGDEEMQNARRIALDLLAEIIERGDL